MQPPFRVEHIGSFLRPQRLLEAARAHKAKRLDEKEFRKIQDESIREIVAFQESLGLPSVTDGEFRRRSWSAGFIDAVDGFGLRDGTLTFRTESSIIGVAASPYARAPLRRKHRIVADDYRFLRSTVKRGVPKATVASPPVMHYFLGPQAFERGVYPDREAFFSDLVKLYRDEIADLAAEGCTYLQLDDTALPCNCDPNARKDVVARAENPDELTERYARLFNDCIGAIDGTHIAAKVPDAVTLAFRNRKGFISQNVLATCDFDNLIFTYILAGWEGSQHDGAVFESAFDHGFEVSAGTYYLGDAGFGLTPFCLTPY